MNKDTTFLTQTDLYLKEEPQGNRNDEWNCKTGEEALLLATKKYGGYGAEFGRISIQVFTRNEWLDIIEDHIAGDNPDFELGDDGEELDSSEPVEDETQGLEINI